MGKGGEIFVFDMGKPVRIADLAKRMIALSGVDGIDIKYVGLRDGEKLYEEVLNDKEATVPTHHPKIMVAKVREYPYELACQNEQELYDLSFTYDDMAVDLADSLAASHHVGWVHSLVGRDHHKLLGAILHCHIGYHALFIVR